MLCALLRRLLIVCPDRQCCEHAYISGRIPSVSKPGGKRDRKRVISPGPCSYYTLLHIKRAVRAVHGRNYNKTRRLAVPNALLPAWHGLSHRPYGVNVHVPNPTSKDELVGLVGWREDNRGSITLESVEPTPAVDPCKSARGLGDYVWGHRKRRRRY